MDDYIIFWEQFSISYYVLSKLLIIKYLIFFAGNTTSNTDVLSIYKGRKYENAHVWMKSVHGFVDET